MPEGEEVLEDAGVAAGLGVLVGVEAGAGGLQAASRHRLAVRRRAVFFINWMRMMDSAAGKLSVNLWFSFQVFAWRGFRY